MTNPSIERNRDRGHNCNRDRKIVPPFFFPFISAITLAAFRVLPDGPTNILHFARVISTLRKNRYT